MPCGTWMQENGTQLNWNSFSHTKRARSIWVIKKLKKIVIIIYKAEVVSNAIWINQEPAQKMKSILSFCQSHLFFIFY